MSGLHCKNGHELGIWPGGVWTQEMLQAEIDAATCRICHEIANDKFPDLPWPRIAVYDEVQPPFGLRQELPKAPVFLVSRPEQIRVAQIYNMTEFCKVMGLDYPDQLSCEDASDPSPTINSNENTAVQQYDNTNEVG
jgi:hypothetical protein